MVKNLLEMQETQVRSLCWEDPLEKGMTTHSSVLAWIILWTESQTGGLQTWDHKQSDIIEQLALSLFFTQKLLQVDREVLIHSQYSPDITPLDFHLFQPLQNYLNRKKFNSLEDCRRHLEQFFAQKDKMFWEYGIMKLPEKWQKVLEQSNEYIFQLSSW